jgi:hypothetical protein
VFSDGEMGELNDSPISRKSDKAAAMDKNVLYIHNILFIQRLRSGLDGGLFAKLSYTQDTVRMGQPTQNSFNKPASAVATLVHTFKDAIICRFECTWQSLQGSQALSV